jgi:hypothetical protein
MKMVVAVQIDVCKEDSVYLPNIQEPTVYHSWPKALNMWCRDFNNLIEELNMIGAKVTYTEFEFEAAGVVDNKWHVEWTDVDGKKMIYESMLTTAATK